MPDGSQPNILTRGGFQDKSVEDRVGEQAEDQPRHKLDNAGRQHRQEALPVDCEVVLGTDHAKRLLYAPHQLRNTGHGLQGQHLFDQQALRNHLQQAQARLHGNYPQPGYLAGPPAGCEFQEGEGRTEGNCWGVLG